MINNKAREISADEFGDRQAQIDNTLMDLHTAMPAIVISYDPETRTVKAQPAIQRVYSDGEGLSGPVNLPPCVDVPVLFPGGGGFDITFPVKEGDNCLLIFAERSIDNWFGTGNPSTPGDYRHHDLSDAFAIVGVKNLANMQAAPTDAMRIGGESGSVTITEESVSLVKGSAKMELTDERLTSNVDIYCPNLFTDKTDVNSHKHGGVEIGTGETMMPKER